MNNHRIGQSAYIVAAVSLGMALAACTSSGAAPTVTVTATQTVGPSQAAESSESLPTTSSTPTPAPTSTATAVPVPDVPPALAIAQSLADSVDSAYDVQKVTAKNDPNDLLGRPRGYISAAYVYDENSESYGSELDVDLGAKVEVFKTEREARSRYNYLISLFSDNPMLGGEYTYIEGPVLLRVAQAVPPKVARQYRERFRTYMASFS